MKRLVLTLILVCAGRADSQQVMKVETDKDPATRIIPVEWGVPNKLIKADGRITAQDQVQIRVTGFNFVRFGVKHDTQLEELPSYKALSALWTQIPTLLTPPVLPKPPVPAAADGVVADTFVAMFRIWRDAINKTSVHAKALADSMPRGVALNGTDMGNLKKWQATIDTLTRHLESARKRAYDASASAGIASQLYYAQQVYTIELQLHNKTMSVLAALAKGVATSLAGSTIDIGKKEEGNRVTVALNAFAVDSTDQAAMDSALATGSRSVQYFVASKYPVVFFAGPVYRDIANVDVEKIAVTGGQELFQQVANPNQSGNLATFLGYELGKNSDDTGGIYLTLGTDVTKPGETLYGGLTFRLFSRLFITGGASTLEDTEGQAPSATMPDLFTRIRSTRRWGYYFSIGTTPF